MFSQAMNLGERPQFHPPMAVGQPIQLESAYQKSVMRPGVSQQQRINLKRSACKTCLGKCCNGRCRF